ncbi:universal stress protein [Phyllobacterium brassicacearum]|uniref:Universal stress protein n=1 Tax=Phyllobacterium brassicacearum TaxID=314235 RepID=A0A2P7BUH5_9HYPH|nr:universal stress protein [Phyllobacterium brassicacearum]PSH70042.1 universal stress protein [Phyllobacterium brassicacearum]TDQ34101.1 nucleotide-binding universal stress UspA family protein [Phyllobacterium brassicacearum]
MNLETLLSLIDSKQVDRDRKKTDELRSDIDTLKTFINKLEVLLSDADKPTTLVDDLPDSTWEAHLIGRRARFRGATVIGRDLLENENLKERAVRSGLFESDGPILIVPRGCKPPLQPNCILLAWDSSVECTRAAHEVLDLMIAAEEVHVTLVDADNGPTRSVRDAGDHIVAYLTGHGITAVLDRLPSQGKSIASVLKHHARDISADLIVIGNHCHSHMFERVSGGVTESMINAPSIPVLMAH